MMKLKRAAAVAIVAGGMVFCGGAAHGDDFNQSTGDFCTVTGQTSGDGRGNGDPSEVTTGNLQSAECDQNFEAGGAVPLL